MPPTRLMRTARSRPRLDRRQLVNHPTIQGALVWRLLVIWSAGVISGACAMGLWQYVRLAEPSKTIVAGLALLSVSTGALLLLGLDLMRLSNRFVAPVHQVRRALELVAEGQSIRPLVVRRKDYWVELVAAVNLLASNYDALQPACEVADRPAEPATRA